MFTYRGAVQLRRKCALFYIARNMSAQAAIAQESTVVDTRSDAWASAKPYHSLPGPSKFELIRAFMKGGKYHGMTLLEMNAEACKEYGDIFRVPGTFGKRDVVYTFNPVDYQLVYRTEGQWPVRRGFDILEYYRNSYRQDLFKNAAGLVAEHGEGWARFRTAVNPVMMNPKTITLYTPRMNKVSDEFIKRIRHIRDPHTQEMPPDFEKDVNNWTMDTIGLVALDTELGMINNSEGNPVCRKVIEGMRAIMEVMYDLDMKPSLWKYVATPKYTQAMKTLDSITDMLTDYIDLAMERMKMDEAQRLADNLPPVDVSEQSILERLLKVDRKVAIVMAIDTLLAGTETTTSAFTSCLLCLAKNPEQQQKLRNEVLQILPHKDTALTAEKMLHMPYLRACIKEAFRMYPVNTVNFRATGADIVLSGYRVPKDTDIAMPFQLLMDDTRYYLQPEKFIPERWLRGEAAATDADGCPMNRKVPYVYLPFGFGPRTCIGKRIVDLELEVALTKLVRNFEIGFDYPAENMFRMTILNVPAKPLQFKFVDLPQ